jgi:hypothetical protein
MPLSASQTARWMTAPPFSIRCSILTAASRSSRQAYRNAAPRDTRVVERRRRRRVAVSRTGPDRDGEDTGLCSLLDQRRVIELQIDSHEGTRARISPISKVAERAGVSRTTVSHVLNHADRVSPALRERVQAAIRELGYVPSPQAQSLRTGRTNLVAMLRAPATPSATPSQRASRSPGAGTARGCRRRSCRRRDHQDDREKADETAPARAVNHRTAASRSARIPRLPTLSFGAWIASRRAT